MIEDSSNGEVGNRNMARVAHLTAKGHTSGKTASGTHTKRMTPQEALKLGQSTAPGRIRADNSPMSLGSSIGGEHNASENGMSDDS